MSRTNAKILDACCGSRMFWFDRENKNTLYMDKRDETIELYDGRMVHVHPDVVADFRDMPFENESFYLVCFDPPHLKWVGQKSIMKAKYGELDRHNWQEDIARGFAECYRVLKPNGTLVFKWAESQVSLKQVLDAIPYQPLFGNKKGDTHWLVFFKTGQEITFTGFQHNLLDIIESGQTE